MITLGESTGDPEVVDEIITTLRAAGEAVGRSADGVLAMFVDAGSTTLFDFVETELIGLRELRSTAESLTQATRAHFSYPTISVQQLGDTTALSLALCETDIEFADAPAMRLHTRVTDVWVKTDGRWLAVHEHASVPIDLVNGTAVLDAPTRPTPPSATTTPSPTTQES